MATDTTAMDLDSRCNCSTCKTRMSSLMHDSHLMCTNWRGCDCNMDIRCVEYEGWSEEAMLKYIKYHKSLDSKSKSKKDKISASADQASLLSSRDSNVSQASTASAGISEARVAELICNHTFPVYLISTSLHPRRNNRPTHRHRKRRFSPLTTLPLSLVVS